MPNSLSYMEDTLAILTNTYVTSILVTHGIDVSVFTPQTSTYNEVYGNARGITLTENPTNTSRIVHIGYTGGIVSDIDFSSMETSTILFSPGTLKEGDHIKYSTRLDSAEIVYKVHYLYKFGETTTTHYKAEIVGVDL